MAALFVDRPQLIEDCCQPARGAAARETGLPPATFAETCPFTLDQLLDEDFWPEKDHADD